MKRIISLILVASMLTLSAVSCSDTPAETETNAPLESSGTESTEGSEQESAQEEEQEEEPDQYAHAKELYAAIPTYDLEGEDVPIAVSIGWADSEKEVNSDGLNGEGINDAVYLRTAAVNDRFNCKIVQAPLEVNTAVSQSVQSGDSTLKIAFPQISGSLSLAKEGYLLNLLSNPSMNLTEAWYDQGTYSFQLMGKLYAINGDIHIVDDSATYLFLFNKSMAEENNLGNLYDLVKEGKWTIDAMKEMSDIVSKDADGNGTYDANDIYGYMAYEMTDAFFYGSGLSWTSYNSEGLPQVTLDSERATAILDKVGTFFSAGHSYYTNTDSSLVFKNGQGLFLNEAASYIITMSDMEDEFGIIPIPKYDEQQEGYHSYMHPGAITSAIPNTGNDEEMVGAIIEALAIQSHMLLKPAYYDTALQRRYSRDEESSEMLDLIFENRTYDLGFYLIDNLYAFFGKFCYSGASNFMSRYKSMSKVFDIKMNEYLDALISNQE